MRTIRMITSQLMSEGITFMTHLEIPNYIATSYSSARITTEEAMIKQMEQWVSRRLTPHANMRLAEPIILLRRAISKGSRNKAPGADCIVHEFYVHFWDVITTDLLTIYNLIPQNSDLNSAQTFGTTVRRSVRHRVPWTTSARCRYTIPIKKLWACLSANAFNDPQWHPPQ
jgi:hypothetical protein